MADAASGCIYVVGQLPSGHRQQLHGARVRQVYIASGRARYATRPSRPTRPTHYAALSGRQCPQPKRLRTDPVEFGIDCRIHSPRPTTFHTRPTLQKLYP